MAYLRTIACLLLLVVPAAVHADENGKAKGQIEAAKAAIEAFARRAGDNKLASREIDAAREALKRGEEVFDNNRNRAMLGLGDLIPEAAAHVKHQTDLVELHLTLGQSRIDAGKASEELKGLSAQLAKAKGKVKLFEDRKAELERLRAVQAKYEAALKDLETLKAENARLSEREKTLVEGQKSLNAKLDHLEGELYRARAAAAAPPAPQPPPAADPAPRPAAKQ